MSDSDVEWEDREYQGCRRIGYAAAKAGEPRSSCPYNLPGESDLRAGWMDGYDEHAEDQFDAQQAMRRDHA